MTTTTKQRRTAASVVEVIRTRFVEEQQLLLDAEAEVLQSKARLWAIQNVLNDVEKEGSLGDES